MGITKPLHASVKGKNSNFFYCDCKKRYSNKKKLTTHLKTLNNYLFMSVK